MKTKFYKIDDEIVGTVYKLEGFDNPYKIISRVFVENIESYRGGKKERRYFPQIDDYENEEQIKIGDDVKGYKMLSDAKQALLEETLNYLKNNEANICKYYGDKYKFQGA